MQIKRRRLFVLLLVGTQLGCMTFGVVWASQWLYGAFEDVIYRNIAAQNGSLLSEFARQINERPITNIEPGSSGWKRLQRLCERVKPPHDGFASVIRRDTGALVCHSLLTDNPTLLGRFPGRSPLVTRDSIAPLIEVVKKSEAAGERFVAGQIEAGGALYAVTCLSLPKMNAVLTVHKSEVSIDQSVAELVNPLLQVGLVLTLSVVGVSGLITMFLVTKFETTLTTVSESVDDQVEWRTQTLLHERNSVVFGLARLAESRSKDTGRHLDRIRTYVTILASELAKTHSEIDYHFVANLAVASALHDVGKVGVPDAVLLKLGKLTPGERRAMQLHTVLGAECLASMLRQIGDDDFLEMGRQVAVAHHEQWDGSGYPRGLQGRDIPLAARIVALADVYDALTSHRPYRPAISHAEAREWIVAQYGQQFDPAVVEAFVARELDFVKVSQSCAEPPERATRHQPVSDEAERPAADLVADPMAGEASIAVTPALPA